MKEIIVSSGFLAASFFAVALVSADQTDKEFEEMLESSLRSKGIVKAEEVLAQDEVQKKCSTSGVTSAEDMRAILDSQLATIVYPNDGKYLGDWKAGEKIAQSGKGRRFNDKPDTVNGGNCYACHQISNDELAYGTIGPSLYQYGKIRGNSEEMIKYTWAKIFNAQAFVPCSYMPRYGHKGILSEQQMKDLMALLFDPESPTNK